MLCLPSVDCYHFMFLLLMMKLCAVRSVELCYLSSDHSFLHQIFELLLLLIYLLSKNDCIDGEITAHAGLF